MVEIAKTSFFIFSLSSVFYLLPPSQLVLFFPSPCLILAPRRRLHGGIPTVSNTFSRGGKRERSELKAMLIEAAWEPAVTLSFLAGVRGQKFPASCPACVELFRLGYKKQRGGGLNSINTQLWF